MSERRSEIKIDFLRENPPRGKLATEAVIKEQKSILDSFEASRILGITRRHLYNLMKAGKIMYKRKGGRHFFKVRDLHRWMIKTGRDKPLAISASGTKELWLDK